MLVSKNRLIFEFVIVLFLFTLINNLFALNHERKIVFANFDETKNENIKNAAGIIFGGEICKKCDYLKNVLVPELVRINNSKINTPLFLFVNMDKSENILLLMNLEKTLGGDGSETPVLLWNDNLYYGNDAIENLLKIKDSYQGNRKAVAFLESSNKASNGDRITTLKNRAGVLKIPIVIGAGFLDGINPCVFSTLVFFMSMLSVARIKGKKLLLVGSAYCISCFLTYLLLGFGALQVFKFLSAFAFLRSVLNFLTLLFLLACSIVSFRDAWAFQKSKNPNDVKLKLPDALKMKINSVFRKNLTAKFLLPGALFLGFFVTLIESVCTGQVYVPVLILLSKENFFSKWFFYLLVYNFAFILPLIAVFAFTFLGVSINSMLKMSRQNVVYSKIMMAFMFLALSFLVFLMEFFQ